MIITEALTGVAFRAASYVRGPLDPMLLLFREEGPRVVVAVGRRPDLAADEMMLGR